MFPFVSSFIHIPLCTRLPFKKMFDDSNRRSVNLTITFLDDEMMIARSGGIGEVFLWLRA